MDDLSSKKYMHTTRKRFDPTALVLSLLGLGTVVYVIVSNDAASSFLDPRSLIIVIGGTFASLLFQFDFSSSFQSLLLIVKSFFGTPEKKLWAMIKQLDEAIIQKSQLNELRDGEKINGELLNDMIYMHKQGLVYEEINEFVTSRIADEYLGRRIAVDMLRRAAVIAPALGLFGTVMGLIGVLKSLSDPAQIGPSMSLALMTTAYGAGLGSLIFTPLAGRLEHHNTIYLEVHQQILSKLAVLISRSERHVPQQAELEVAAA
ncbi:MAG: motility protein A [Oligoflexus sp.]